MVTIASQEITHTLLHPAPSAPFSAIGGSQLQALRHLTTIFDAALPHASTVTSVPVHVPSNLTNAALSPGCQSPSHAAPVPLAIPTEVHDSLFPSHAHPRMGINQSPSPRVSPLLASSPGVGPSRAPYPRVRPSQAPYPRVFPSQSPSPRVRPSQAPTAVTTTLHHPRQQQPSPRAHGTPTHRASPHGNGTTGTNLYGDFADVVGKAEVPPQHRTRSQTARHSSHASCAMPMANAVIHPTIGANMKYRGLISDDETFPTWDRAAANEFGRLVQVVGGRIEGSNTIFFIPRSSVPRNKTVTNGRFVVDVRPNKEEVHRVRLTVGGNLIKYNGDVSTISADLTT
jgi:hypothetical protein